MTASGHPFILDIQSISRVWYARHFFKLLCLPIRYRQISDFRMWLIAIGGGTHVKPNLQPNCRLCSLTQAALIRDSHFFLWRNNIEQDTTNDKSYNWINVAGISISGGPN